MIVIYINKNRERKLSRQFVCKIILKEKSYLVNVLCGLVYFLFALLLKASCQINKTTRAPCWFYYFYREQRQKFKTQNVCPEKNGMKAFTKSKYFHQNVFASLGRTPETLAQASRNFKEIYNLTVSFPKMVLLQNS